MLKVWLDMQRAWLEQGQRLAATMPTLLGPAISGPALGPARAAATKDSGTASPAGTTGTDGDARSMLTPDTGTVTMVSERPLLASDLTASGEAFRVMQLLAEDLEVERRQVEAGRVQVRLVTRTEPHEVNEELARMEAEIERVPIGLRVETVPPVRETEDRIIIPVVEEILVVERRLMLREEVHVHKRHISERHHEQVLLRIQEALVTRHPPQKEEAVPQA